jgi:hypothetical protein
VLVRDLRGTLRVTRGFVRVTGDVTVDRVVVRKATGVVLRGLTVRDGVLVRDARDPVLRDLDVRGGGIRLLRVRGGSVTRVVARGRQAALSVEATPDQVRPRRTMLRRVTLRDSPVGLRLLGARWLTATGLAFAGNGADAQADAASSDVFGV